MTVIDIITLFLLGGGAVFGFVRGFVQEILSIFAWVLVVLAIRFLHGPVTSVLIEPIGTDTGAAVLAFLSIAIITYFLGKQIAKSIGAKSRKSMLGPVDRVLGFGFGALKGLIIGTLLYLLLILSMETIWGDEDKPEWLTQSRTYPILNASGNALSSFIAERRASIDKQDSDSESESQDDGSSDL